MHLSVVSSAPAPKPEFLPEEVDLARQPWRPGELCQVVDLDLPAGLQERLDRAATRQGIPVAVVVLASVEAARVVATVSANSCKARADVEAALDGAAATLPERGVDPLPARRLRAYAQAIFAGLNAPSEATPAQLALRVPQSLSAAWALAAAAEGLLLEHWVLSTLERAELAHSVWEAAAAYAGRSLESWAALTVLAAG